MKRSKRPRAEGQIRIIGGEWRGRHLPVPALADLRPTPDRVRETLFNWLQMDIAGADCLDVFAGSGALGFEAASRGARHVTLIERDTRQARQLHELVGTLGAENVEVVAADAIGWLAQATGDFDIIFLDPPFSGELLASALSIIASRAMLRPNGLVYVELSRGLALPEGWGVHRQTRAGQVQAALLMAPADSS